eukprot:2138592-Pleurochrysis_carterae.AAC.1
MAMAMPMSVAMAMAAMSFGVRACLRRRGPCTFRPSAECSSSVREGGGGDRAARGGEGAWDGGG